MDLLVRIQFQLLTDPEDLSTLSLYFRRRVDLDVDEPCDLRRVDPDVDDPCDLLLEDPCDLLLLVRSLGQNVRS